jgi:hypothetical protein
MRRSIVVIGLILGLALPASAAASSPLTVAIKSAPLNARVQVIVNFTIVCDPINDVANTGVTAAIYGASATVDQASGRAIAHGAGGDLMPGQPLVCDGSTINSRSLSVVSSTVPFHRGKAVIGLAVSVDDPGCQFCGGGVYTTTQQVVSLK